MFKFTEKQQEALNKFDALAEQLGSANKAAARIGIAASTVSQIKSGAYKADPVKQLNKLIEYFENKQESEKNYSAKNYAKTSVSDEVYEIIKNCQLMGGLAIACGDAGIGKTQAAKQYAQDHPNGCVLLTANPCFRSPKSMLKMLGNALNVSANAADDLWIAITSKLTDGTVIIIDEAQHLSLRTIETLRSFSDHFDAKDQTLGICFIGNQETVGRFGGKQKADFAQIRNRTKQTRIYSTANIKKEDIELLFPILSGKEPELEFLLRIAQSRQAVRGAVNLFSTAYNNDNITYDGLVATAKYMNMEV